MNETIDNILRIWHEHFSDESRQYTEFEDSDIEYFVGCMLYNHFAFSKAVDTMKTIDLSYDFLSSCGDEYDEIKLLVQSIKINDELEKIDFLQHYLESAKSKYTKSELYLLDRLQNHLNGIRERFENDEEVKKVEFNLPQPKVSNPLLR